MSEKYGGKVAPASGKLGVLCVGLGAVTTTFMAGVENVRQGRAKAFGSLTQLATIRLGKRTEGRSPLIRDFVPLANLEDLVFGAWDPIPDNAYEAALKAGVLDKHEHIEPIAGFLKAIVPMRAVFDQHYVKRLTGTNVKMGKTKRELADALREDLREFKKKNGCDRLVIVWPVLKSLPPIGTLRSRASCSSAGTSQLRFGAPLANATPSIIAAYA